MALCCVCCIRIMPLCIGIPQTDSRAGVRVRAPSSMRGGGVYGSIGTINYSSSPLQ